MTVVSTSPEATEAAGAAYAGALGPGAVVGLVGGLGSGKTCFVKGAARALGVPGPVNSPTYAIVNVYPGEPAVYHLDAFRLKSADELLGVGFEDIVSAGGVCFIEWADRVRDVLPAGAREVRFRILDADRREITAEDMPGIRT